MGIVKAAFLHVEKVCLGARQDVVYGPDVCLKLDQIRMTARQNAAALF